jgi:putative ABC transport system substrate-binding protein
MRRRALLLAAATPLARPVLAQPSVARIGWLTAQRPASLAAFLPALREGLAEAGWVEGRNLVIEYRYGDDDLSRVPALLSELLGARVQAIVVQGAAVAEVVRLRPPAPVLFAISSNPVAAGLARSLSQPNPGMSGVSFMLEELNEKRLELLREIRPWLRRLAVIANPHHAGEELERAEAERAAARWDVRIAFHHARTRTELDAVLAEVAADAPDGVVVFSDGFALQNSGRLARFALDQRLPLVGGWRSFAEAGALCAYGPRLQESYRRLAHHVDRVLRGARPEDLPIERPRLFEFVFNLRTAAAIGLNVPVGVLARADEVIE